MTPTCRGRSTRKHTGTPRRPSSSLTLIDNQASGSLKAIDVKTGDTKWDVATRSPMVAGVLTTGGGLVFTGDAEGFFTAYDADTGKDLWHFPGNEVSYANPISYLSNGKQQVAIAIGDVLMAFGLD